MSDPNVSAEIEDVLASIQRLISSDDRATKLQQTVPTVGASSPVAPGKLVLTSALRVDGTASRRAAPLVLAAPLVSEDAGHVRSNALKARVAKLEEVVARQADQWRPDGATATVNSGHAGVALRGEDLTSGNSTETAAKARQARADAEGRPNPSDLLQSAELRDLVADIVRQELQGAMGERLTHNLRKLVRREIHLALAERERQ